jgi:hypothetical protein
MSNVLRSSEKRVTQNGRTFCNLGTNVVQGVIKGETCNDTEFCRMFTFGLLLGIWISNANVSEHYVCSIFIGETVQSVSGVEKFVVRETFRKIKSFTCRFGTLL